MSDTHTWPPSASTEAAFAEFAAHRDRVRALADMSVGAVRGMLLAEWQSLEQVERRMRHLLGVAPLRVVASASVPGGLRREVGVNTSYKIRHYAPNQGRL